MSCPEQMDTLSGLRGPSAHPTRARGRSSPPQSRSRYAHTRRRPHQGPRLRAGGPHRHRPGRDRHPGPRLDGHRAPDEPGVRAGGRHVRRPARPARRRRIRRDPARRPLRAPQPGQRLRRHAPGQQPHEPDPGARRRPHREAPGRAPCRHGGEHHGRRGGAARLRGRARARRPGPRRPRLLVPGRRPVQRHRGGGRRPLRRHGLHLPGGRPRHPRPGRRADLRDGAPGVTAQG